MFLKWDFETKPEKCPVCGSTHIAEIQYGTPIFITPKKYILGEENEIRLDPELEAQIKSGEIVLGGCIQHKDSPAWRCYNCKTKLYKPPKNNQ
jgi:RNA polymerase subunit RPABC4/transcription elongation factor Spt4